MKRFIIRTFCIVLPFVVIIATYIIGDPLRVIWDYDDYINKPAKNVAYNSYKLMMRYYDSIPFNSFIVGSSRSNCWSWKELEKHLGSNACAFHLNSSGDGVYNALERLTFVYKNVEQVDNILLIIDENWLSKDYPLTDIQFRTPWQMREKKDFLNFQRDAARYFFSIKGFKQHYRLGEKYRFTLPNFRDERNEPHNIGQEWAVECDPEYYYANIAAARDSYYLFYPRDSVEQIGEPVISEKGIELLSQIHELFVNGNTNYKIVVSPLYDQIKLNPTDKSILDSIFGAENVYDYSGINKYTQDSLNYYESSHYRPRVASQIMNEIYGTAED